MNLKNNLLPILLTIVSLGLSVTEFYSLGYILLVFVLSLYAGSIGIFKTLLQRFVFFFLLLSVLISVVGLLCWMLSTPLHAFYVNSILIIGIFALPTARSGNVNIETPFDKVDLFAVILAIAPIIVIALSYGNAPNHKAALFQLSSEGWDNGSHILMMEANSETNGYVYGTYEETKDIIIESFNAYPQSWHLATSHIVNGFGGNRFDHTKPMVVILAYTTATVIWLMTAIYMFVISLWRFHEHLSKSKVPNIMETSVLVSISTAVILIVFVAALMHGFTNYIGTAVYINIAMAMAMEFIKKSADYRHYFYFIVFSLAAILSWFLVLPALAVAFLLLLLIKYGSIKDGALTIIKKWQFVAITLSAGLAALFQLYIFQKFAKVGAAGQLNAGSLIEPFRVVGSPLHISHVLFGLIIITFFVYFFTNRPGKKLGNPLLLLIIPWLVLVVFVYVYQNITAGQNSYYLTKVVGLCIMTTMIPFGAIIARATSKIILPNPPLLSPLLCILLIFTILLGTGQPLYGLNKLFQRHARTTYGTAEKIVKHLPETTNGEAYIVVLTGRKSYEMSREDHHGKLEIRVVRQPFTCTYYITGYVSINTAVKRLAACADRPEMKDKIIYVLTSPESYKKVKALNRPNIVIDKT